MHDGIIIIHRTCSRLHPWHFTALEAFILKNEFEQGDDKNNGDTRNLFFVGRRFSLFQFLFNAAKTGVQS